MGSCAIFRSINFLFFLILILRSTNKISFSFKYEWASIHFSCWHVHYFSTSMNILYILPYPSECHCDKMFFFGMAGMTCAHEVVEYTRVCYSSLNSWAVFETIAMANAVNLQFLARRVWHGSSPLFVTRFGDRFDVKKFDGVQMRPTIHVENIHLVIRWRSLSVLYKTNFL